MFVVDDATHISFAYDSVPVYRLDILKPHEFGKQSFKKDLVEKKKVQFLNDTEKLVSCCKIAFKQLRTHLSALEHKLEPRKDTGCQVIVKSIRRFLPVFSSIDTKINDLLVETIQKIQKLTVEVFDATSISRQFQIKLTTYSRVY